MHFVSTIYKTILLLLLFTHTLVMEGPTVQGSFNSYLWQWRHAVTGVAKLGLLHYRKVEIPRAFMALSLARKAGSLSSCPARFRPGESAESAYLRNTNSHAVPFCNNDQQSEGQEKEFLCSWSTAYIYIYICKSKPEARVKGSTRKRGVGPLHHPRVTHLISYPPSSSSGKFGGQGGRGSMGKRGGRRYGGAWTYRNSKGQKISAR